MPGIRERVAGALTFAHLAGVRAPQAAKADDDEECKRQDGESDDDYAKRKAEHDKKGKKAEDKKNESDDDDDEEDDDEDKMSTARAEGAAAERARCAAIFAAPAAAANVPLAASLAFETDLSAEKAIEVLGKSPAPRAGLAGRMADAGVPRVPAGGPARPTGPAAIAASWDAATADLRTKG